MTTFTLVAYRPDHSTYCRGCLMDSSSSDHSIEEYSSIDDIALAIARYMNYNDSSDIEYADYKLTTLIDGKTYDDDYEKFESTIAEINVKVHAHIFEFKEQERLLKEKEEARRALEAKIVQEKKNEARYKEYLKLKEEFDE